MTHIEVIVVPDDPADEDAHSDGGLTATAANRLTGVLAQAGFRVVVGPSARPPATVLGGRTRFPGHETKIGPTTRPIS